MRRHVIGVVPHAALYFGFVVHAHAADKSLQVMVREAYACSDALLQAYASHTCDSPETIAAKAVGECRAKWDALTDKALGASSSDTSRHHSTQRQSYSAAMEYEYVQTAALKAIDIRRTAGLCGFD